MLTADVDGVGPDEREVREVALVQLDLDLFVLGESAGVGHLLQPTRRRR